MQKKVVITGAGSAQSNGVINSLLMDGGNEEILGLGSDPFDLMLSKAHRKFLMPHSRSQNYKQALLTFLDSEKPDMIHFQHDLELWHALKFKDEIEEIGVRMLVPEFSAIDTCVHKYKSWQAFKAAGLKVPDNILIESKEDLLIAFEKLANNEGYIWLRATSIGGGGKGALPTNDLEEAVEWIERNEGWGEFTAAEMLTENTVTALSIWRDGELIVTQSRRRKGWAHSALSPSGVTGVTKIGETCSDAFVDEIAEKTVRAVSPVPNGIYGVDMTYDHAGVPNPTEINISRFFTTVQFFAEAGLNMPAILKDLVLYDSQPDLKTKVNPLSDGLLWIRGMDCAPVLTTEEEIFENIKRVE